MLETLKNLYRLGKILKIEKAKDGYVLVPKGKLHLGTTDRPIGSINMDDKTMHMIKESGADFERLTTTYDNANDYYVVKVEKGGSGVLRDLVIVADGATEQIKIGTDGAVDIPGLVSAFVNHTDTPADYEDASGGDVVTVNSGTDGLEFITPVAGVDTFLDLTDTPADYTGGDAGKVVQVNQAENALEFVDSVIDSDYVNESIIITTKPFRTLTIPANTLKSGTTAQLQFHMQSQGNFGLDDADRLEIKLNGTGTSVIIYDSEVVNEEIPGGKELMGVYFFSVDSSLNIRGQNTISVGGGTLNVNSAATNASHDIASEMTITFDWTRFRGNPDGIITFLWARIIL